MTKRKMNQDDAWDSDPVEDMENAIKILKQSTDYKMLGEIEKILIKYGIWPNFPV